MIINKVVIKNFKSISKIEFPIIRYGSSYTSMLIGINESGKSNILEAMSFFETPKKEFDYNNIHNQKDDKNDPVSIKFNISFEQKEKYINEIKEKILNSELLKFKIKNITKTVTLKNKEKMFYEEINFDIEDMSNGLYIRKIEKNAVDNDQTQQFELTNDKDTNNNFEILNKDTFIKYFYEELNRIIKNNEPKVRYWKPSEEYLISGVDLNTFKENINSNIPLKHVFYISGYTSEDAIKESIEKISNMSLRRKLSSTLSEKVTEYIKKIWKHSIIIDIEINDNGFCNVSVKDEGKENKHNFHKMTVRSEGFKQFMSLILSISIETKKLGIKHNLLLIDEPEAHLHPAGIRDLREELLEIGKDNFLFVSTHSPFLVDRKHKERNIVIKKNNKALTEKKVINSLDDLRSDEVLDIAFGINIYKDLLSPHRILVEGASDRMILERSFSLFNLGYGITNGIGSNIVQIASRLNSDEISTLVLVDDDERGRNYRDKILQIKGVYSTNNVFTIRDLVGEIKPNGTIEDTLGKDFIENKFKVFFNNEFSEECNLIIDDKPFIQQIRVYLQKKEKFKDDHIKKFKTILSEDFKPTKTNLNNDFPLLSLLINKIKLKLSP